MTLVKRRNYIGKCVKRLTDEDRKFIGYWFSSQAAAELFALTSAIEELAEGQLLNILYIALSSLIISRGSGASFAMDLSRSRPHRVTSKIPRMPLEAWENKIKELARHYEARGPIPESTEIRLGDARQLDFAEHSVDLIITSPPYVNAIDYIRTSKFSLVFFGYDLASLREIRSAAVGSERGLSSEELPSDLDSLVEKVSDIKRRPMLRRHLFDMLKALQESNRVLKPGGKALYVVGPSLLSRKRYDGGDVLTQIARVAGFRSIGSSRRDLSSTNRSLPPPNLKQNAQSINRRMTCEYYVLLAKE